MKGPAVVAWAEQRQTAQVQATQIQAEQRRAGV